MLALGLFFIRSEGPVLKQALVAFGEAPLIPTLLAALVTGLYVLFSARMYVDGFAATGARVPLGEAVRLWLRRNFISVFLPAGGVSSMAFFNRSLRRHGLDDRRLYLGSLVYFLAGYSSLLLITVPALLFGMGTLLSGYALLGPVGAFVLLLAAGAGYVCSFRRKGWAYTRLVRKFPRAAAQLEDLRTQPLDRRAIARAVLASVGVELCGVAHVWLAVLAMHGSSLSLSTAFVGYVTATLLLAFSPALRGLGAVELSLTLVLTRVGQVPETAAVAATLFYRIFEFWLPLLLGLGSFFWQRTNLLLRVAPAFLTLLLGLLNLLSALTPALTYRVRLLKEFLPIDLLQLSNGLVIAAGGLLVILSVGLLRGYRSAWVSTVVLVGLSMVAHLTKAIDYEEALFAAFVLLVLWYTGAQYRLASPPVKRLVRLRPSALRVPPDEETYGTARQLTEQHGHSALDYFKLYDDKELFLLPDRTGFFAYRRSVRLAVVLEGPVLARYDRFPEALKIFETDCRMRGRQVLYYRVDEQDLPFFEAIGRKPLQIGQEGIVHLDKFTLEGRDRKSLRNALKRVQSAGYQTHTYEPPLSGRLAQQLRAVSDEWLRTEELRETAFAQGVFNAGEIKHQPVVTVEDEEGKVVAFANIIPNFAPEEGTYDLIRKTDDAPSGVMDALMVGLITYLQKQGKRRMNLGLAPLSGLTEPGAFPEQALKLVYDRTTVFTHFKGLRFFKEKFADEWQTKYLVYGDDLDLMQAAVAIQRVSRYLPGDTLRPPLRAESTVV